MRAAAIDYDKRFATGPASVASQGSAIWARRALPAKKMCAHAAGATAACTCRHAYAWSIGALCAPLALPAPRSWPRDCAPQGLGARAGCLGASHPRNGPYGRQHQHPVMCPGSLGGHSSGSGPEYCRCRCRRRRRRRCRRCCRRRRRRRRRRRCCCCCWWCATAEASQYGDSCSALQGSVSCAVKHAHTAAGALVRSNTGSTVLFKGAGQTTVGMQPGGFVQIRSLEGSTQAVDSGAAP